MKTIRYVYGLDLSMSSTGVAIFTNDGRLVKVLSIDTRKKKETQTKLLLIGEQLSHLISHYEPEVVVIEAGFTRFNKSTQSIFRVHGLANYLFGLYTQIYYPPTAVKKTLTGIGNAEKDVLYRIVQDRFPDTMFKNYDESDAAAVALTHFIKNEIIT